METETSEYPFTNLDGSPVSHEDRMYLESIAEKAIVSWRMCRIADALIPGSIRATEGQTWVIDGVYDSTVQGAQKISVTVEPWGLDLTLCALTGEQRAGLLKQIREGAELAYAGSIGATVLWMGARDYVSGERYFQSPEQILASDEPGWYNFVFEAAHFILWLSGIIEAPERFIDLKSPGRETPSNLDDISFLLRWTRTPTSDPDEKDLLHSLAAGWMFEQWPESRTAPGNSPCGYVGISIKRELTKWYKDRNDEGRLRFWSGIAKGRKNIGLDNAKFFYNQAKRTRKAKPDDEEGQEEKLGYILRRIRTEVPVEPAERLSKQESCVPQVSPDPPRAKADELRLEMERLRGQLELISDMDVVARVQRELQECEQDYQAIQEAIIYNTVRSGWIVEPCGGRTLDDFDSTAMVDCDVRSVFEAVHRREQTVSTKPWEVLKRLSVASSEHAGQTQTDTGGWVAKPQPNGIHNGAVTLGAGWRCLECNTPKSRYGGGTAFRSPQYTPFPDLSNHKESWITSCGCRIEGNLIPTLADVRIPNVLAVSRTPGYEITGCILCKLPEEVRLRVPKLEGRHICSLMVVAWPPPQHGLGYHGRVAVRDSQVIVHRRQLDASIQTVWWQHQAELTKRDARLEIFKLLYLDNFNECDLAEEYGEKRVRAAAEWIRAHRPDLEREFWNGGWRRQIADTDVTQVA